MTSLRPMHGAPCLAAPRMLTPGKIIQHPRSVKASAESIGLSNVVVGPTSNVRELANVGGGRTRYVASYSRIINLNLSPKCICLAQRIALWHPTFQLPI